MSYLQAILLIPHLFICTICLPQRERIDSLKKLLPSLKDSVKIDCLNEMSEMYLQVQLDTAGIYAEQALQAAEKISYTIGIAKAYKNLTRRECILQTDFASAEKYANMCLAFSIKAGDERLIAWGWFALGYTSWVLCKFPKSIEAYEKAIPLYEKEKDTSNLAEVYQQLRLAAREWGRYEKGLQYELKYQQLSGTNDYEMMEKLYSDLGDYETALEYTRKSPSQGEWQDMDIGTIFYNRKQYDSAMHYYQRFGNSVKGTVHIGKFYALVGEVQLAKKQYDTALAYLTKALNLQKKTNDRNQVMLALALLSKTYIETGAYDSAFKTTRELLKMADETGARQYSRDAHFLLYKLFKQFQKPESAYTHLQQYNIFKDSIDLDLSAQKLLIVKTITEKERRAQSNVSALNDQKKLQDQRLKQSAQQRNFLIVGSIALLLIAVVVFRNISLKRKNEKLRLENELKLQQLGSEKTKAELLQQASELEMQALRAQMNPHFIFNSLNSINSFILENERLQASEYLSKFSRLVRLILQNSRETLIPLDRELEALGLYLELESLRFEEKFEYKIWVNDDVDTAVIKVPPLIIQPYAENAIWHGLMHLPADRHGKKRRARLLIELYHENAVLYCKITDNGVGRKIAEERKDKSSLNYKSIGMKITADRIGMLQQQKQNGNLITVNDLVSPDGQPAGTEVLIKMPLQYD